MATVPLRLLAPLRVRDFALLWAGQTVSLVGNGVFTVALTWEALAVAGPRGLSLVLVATFLPSTVLLLAGGVVSDRGSRRLTLLLCDAVQAVAVGLLAVVSLAGDVALWHLVAAGAVAGAASGFFLPASTALLPDVLPRDLLVAANSLNTVSRLTAARLVGPALGGVLVASVGVGVAFAVDAASFAVSAIAVSLLRVRRTSPAAPASGSVLADVREGLAYCLRRRWLAVSLAAFAVLNLCTSAPLAVLVPVYVTDHLGRDARALGLLLVVEGVGGGVAALVAAQLRSPRRLVVATHFAFALSGLALAAMAGLRSVVLAAVCLAAVGFLLELGNVYWATALQQNVPGDLLGRVSSVDWLVSGSLAPVGMALAGTAAATTTVASVLALGGLATLLASAAAAFTLRTRDPATRQAP